MRGLLTLRWNDPVFKWNPNETRITYVEMPVDKMWKPTLVLNESRSHDYASVFYENKLAFVYYDGSVMWESAVKTSTFCQVLQTTFPFDRQACKLTFSFAANHHGELIFSHRNTTPGHTDSGAWEVTNVFVPYCPEKMEFTKHSAIRFAVDLKRARQQYYVDTLVVPIFLLCVLTSLVVFVPAKSQQKIPLIITTVLALFVYQGLVDSIGPPTGNPLLGTFTLIVICAGVFATFASIWSLRLAYLDYMLPCRVEVMEVKADEESAQRVQTAEEEPEVEDNPQGDSQQEDGTETGGQASNVSNVNESSHCLPCKPKECTLRSKRYVFFGEKMCTTDFAAGCILVLFNLGCIIGFAIKFIMAENKNDTIAVNYCSDDYDV